MKYYYVLKTDEGEIRAFEFKNLDEMLCDASYILAFRDCFPCDIEKIVADGREVYYVGWQPNMVYEYWYRDNEELCWIGYFPEWDH